MSLGISKLFLSVHFRLKAPVQGVWSIAMRGSGPFGHILRILRWKFMKFQRSSEANHWPGPITNSVQSRSWSRSMPNFRFSSNKGGPNKRPECENWTESNKNAIYLLIYAHSIKYVDSTKASLLWAWSRCAVPANGSGDQELENLHQEWKPGAWNPWKLLVRFLSCLFVGLCNPLRMTACIGL